MANLEKKVLTGKLSRRQKRPCILFSIKVVTSNPHLKILHLRLSDDVDIGSDRHPLQIQTFRR